MKCPSTNCLIAIILYLLLIFLTLQNSFGQSINKSYKNCINEYQNNHGNPEVFRECLIGLQSPSFNVTSTNGKVYSSTTLKGKVVLLNFWFTTCQPCIKEIPNLNFLHKKFKGRPFELISFSPDNNEEVEKFIKKYPMNYSIISNAKQQIKEDFQIIAIGYPTSILVNKAGQIMEFRSGIPSDEAGISKVVSELETMITSELNK